MQEEYYVCKNCGLRKRGMLPQGFWNTKRGIVCGSITNYDRMSGNKYCQHVLKQITPEEAASISRKKNF